MNTQLIKWGRRRFVFTPLFHKEKWWRTWNDLQLEFQSWSVGDFDPFVCWIKIDIDQKMWIGLEGVFSPFTPPKPALYLELVPKNWLVSLPEKLDPHNLNESLQAYLEKKHILEACFLRLSLKNEDMNVEICYER